MNEKDIKYLLFCIKAGLIVWYNLANHWEIISRIAYNHEEEYFVAYMIDGKFAALASCEREHFLVTSPEITEWPD